MGRFQDKDVDMWVIAGVPLRAPLKPIFTNTDSKDAGDGEEQCTTPTGDSAKIATRVSCPPPPPRKRKQSLKFRYGGVREFFTPPHDLESVFVRRVESTR